MWLEKKEKETPNDPYGRNQPSPTVGSGSGGGGAPLGSGETSQTFSNPSTVSPAKQAPQQKEASVQDYLSANKEQGNQLGQQFESKLNDVGAKDKSAIDTAASTAKNQANAATVSYDSGLVNNAVKDPTSVANDPNQLQKFLGQWNAAYTGPSSFESSDSYTSAAKANEDAKTKAAEIGDAGGRKQILQDEFGVYGQGNKGLDHTLLQNADNFGDVLDTGKQFASLPDYFAKQAADVNNVTKTAADTTAATKANAQGAFANSLTNFQTDLTNKVTADQKAATDTVNKIKAQLASGDSSQIEKTLAASNLSNQQKSDIRSYLTTLNSAYGVKPDLNNYYTYNPNTDITSATAASSADYAKAKALQALTGVDYSGVLNPADVSKADTWNNAAAGLQGASLQTYLKNSLAQQDKEALAKTNLTDLSAKLNMPSIVDPANYSNRDLGQKSAQALISVAQRNNLGRGQNGTPNNLDNLYHEAATKLVQTANGGVLDRNNPAIAGILQFVRTLGTYLYGAPQY